MERYGDIRGPENKAVYESCPDETLSLRSAYRLFGSIAETEIGKDRPRSKWYSNDSLVESLYSEACRFFDHSSLNARDSSMVMKAISEAGAYRGGGIFLSALLNRRGMEELFIESFPDELDVVGYRIGEGKRLLIGKGVKAANVGMFGRGTVLSWGDVDNMGTYAEKGFYGNWGKCSMMGYIATGGVRANYGYTNDMGYFSRSGISANFGGGLARVLSPEPVIYREPKSKFVDSAGFNLGKHARSSARYELYSYYALTSFMEYLAARVADPKLALLERNMFTKLKEIKFMKGFAEPNTETLEKIRGFDFEGFEKEVSEIHARITEHRKGRYG